MKINVNVKRTFKVNGKQYNSIEEMPPDIREAYEKAIGSKAGLGNLIHTAPVQTKIIFNGAEYHSIDAMPQNVRQLYERLLKSTETGAAQTDIDIAGISSGMLTETETSKAALQGDVRRPLKAESSFSSRALIISATVVVLVLLLYYLFAGR